jgi:hypothetical protein
MVTSPASIVRRCVVSLAELPMAVSAVGNANPRRLSSWSSMEAVARVRLC